MKKTIIKIFLLLAAIALAVFGVWRFIDTILGPLDALEYANCHDAELQRSVDRVKDDILSSPDTLMNNYSDCQYKLQRYYAEDLVSNNQHDNHLTNLARAFAPKFAEMSRRAFNRSDWDIAPWDHDYMKERVEELTSLELSDGTEVLNASDLADIYWIEDILERYDDACDLVKNKTWLSTVDNITRYVSEANGYLADATLMKCSYLQSSLSSYTSTVHQNFFAYYDSQISKLTCSDWGGYISFSNTIHNYYDELEKYERTFGWRSTIDDLENLLIEKEYNALKQCVEYANNVNNFETFYEYEKMQDAIHEQCFDNYAPHAPLRSWPGSIYLNGYDEYEFYENHYGRSESRIY